VNVACHFCGGPVDPTARETWRRIAGWERKGFGETRRGGSDIVLRAPVDEFAHAACVAAVLNGVAIGQTSLV
jgi:hypothetical protein